MEKDENIPYTKDDMEIKNLNFYIDISPNLSSWVMPVEDRGRSQEIEFIMYKNLNDGKMTDIDMGFRNNGLQ